MKYGMQLLGVRHRRPPAVRIGSDQLVGVLAGRDADHPHLADDRPGAPRQAPLRRRLAREVDVIGQGDRIGIAVGELDLAGGQRRTEAGDHVLEAGLVSGHHVGVALDDDGELLPPDRALGEVDPVQRPALVEEGGRRRVEVFRSFRVGHDAAAEADRPPARVADRDDDPATEPVVDPATGRRTGDARIGQLTVAEALGSQPGAQRLPRVRRVADAEALLGLAAEAALLEIGASPLRLARLEQDLAVPRDRRLECLAEASTATVLPRRPRAELDAGRSASRDSASRKSSPSRRMTNVKMSPCSPQPKQCHVSRSGVTMKDGVFSAWKGQRPFWIVPARLSATVSPTTSATGSFALISATMPEEEVMAPPSRARSTVVKCFVKVPGPILPDCQVSRHFRARASHRCARSVHCPAPHRTAPREPCRPRTSPRHPTDRPARPPR